MDPRVAIVLEFSRSFAKGMAKVETEQCGFPFLDTLLRGGGRLEYGELTPLRLAHRYKLVDIPEHRMVDLVRAHVDNAWNVCRYFAPSANDTLCFNVDDNRRTPSTGPNPEIDVAVRALGRYLRDVGCEPLTVASGRGYHVWCRTSEPIDNGRLYEFLLTMAARALAAVQNAGYDHTAIKMNLYPNERLRRAVSLRLFGSRHVKSKRFSHVLGPEGLLDEEASWGSFDDFVRRRAISPAQFDAASRTLAKLLEAGGNALSP